MFLLVPAHPGCPGQIPQNRKTVVCVCRFYQCFNSLCARGSNFSESVFQHLVAACCKPYLLYGCDVIMWIKSELSNISYAFNFVLYRIYRVKHDLLSCICEYRPTEESYILEEISNRHRCFVKQLLCSRNLLVRCFASISIVLANSTEP